MKKCKVIKNHVSDFPVPIKFSAGDELFIRPKKKLVPGWIWLANKEGITVWVPEEYVDIQEEKCTGKVEYDAFELTIESGNTLSIINWVDSSG